MTEIPSISPQERKVLEILNKRGKMSLEEITKEANLKDKSEAAAIIAKLESKGLVEIERVKREYVLLGPEGEKYAVEGFPERKILEKLAEGDIAVEKISEITGLEKNLASIALGWVLRKKWGKMEKIGDSKVLKITDEGYRALGILGEDEKLIKKLKEVRRLTKSEVNERILKTLLSRKNVLKIEEETVLYAKITEKGIKALQEAEVEVGALTPEMIRAGSWRNVKFRRYGLEGYVGMLYAGRRHPMTYLIRKIRRIFLEMGFKEIRGDFVTSAFWNMDALFVPQDHPARDLQDTYYLLEPSELEVDENLALKIKEIHETGGTTLSKGWRYEWSLELAKKALLRSHTTAITIKYLAEHPEEYPIRVFIIGKVFRREAIDATHLSEFTQIDGIIVEEDANLRMLIGVLKEFYRKLGFKEVRVRPSYFPYTEPSLEIFVKFKGKWLELGGAGIFRPEVTEPLGIKGRVLAWGLGLERLIAILMGLDDIRKIYITDISWLRKSPIIIR